MLGAPLIPIIGAVLTGAGVAEISDFYLDGLDRVMKVVVMFIFAIIYFGIMIDVGLFDRLVETRRGAQRRGVHKDIDVAEARIVCLAQRLPKP